MEITGTIENWFQQQVTAKEFIIWGNLYEDINNRWPEAVFMHTSGIKNRECKEGDIVQTRNSVYKLGKKLEIEHAK